MVSIVQHEPRQLRPELRLIRDEERERYDAAHAAPRKADTWVKAPTDVLRDTRVSPSARLLYLLLLDYRTEERGCFPGQERLAKDLGQSVRQVRRIMDELVGAGWVKTERGGRGHPNRYALDYDRTDMSHQALDRTQTVPIDRTYMSAELYEKNINDTVPTEPEPTAAPSRTLPLSEHYNRRYQDEKNHGAVLGDLFSELWPTFKPDYPILGKLNKELGAGALTIALMIEAASHRTSDDPHPYLLAMAKRKHAQNGRGGKVPPTPAEHPADGGMAEYREIQRRGYTT